MLKRMLVDKIIGAIGILMFVSALGVLYRGLTMIGRGRSFVTRMIGAALVGLAMPIAVVTLYAAYYLLRYPAERRSTAAELERIAARESGPLTLEWTEE